VPGSYDIGDVIVLTLTFKVSGVLTDPDAATAYVEEPNGTVTTIPAARVTTGVWEASFTPVQAGEHWWRGQGTGAAQAAGEDYFTVREQRVTP